ncbi:hypothetical protein NECID01_0660 [Nematocida sp. AWRm77]|nr:hypothetical protein NECID01_0660 [Nematocida sp. AWRm77]
MKVSEIMRHVSSQLKRFLDQEVPKDSVSGVQAGSFIDKALAPLQSVFQKLPKVSETSFLSTEDTAPNLFIFHMIVESLCSKGAFESASLLLEEMESIVPATKETHSVEILRVYDPWAEELSYPMADTLSRTSTTLQEWREIKQISRAYIAEAKASAQHKEEHICALYESLKTYALLDREKLSQHCIEKNLSEIVESIRSMFAFEGTHIVYCKGPRTLSISRESKHFRKILSVLSLLVSPIRTSDVERFTKQVCIPGARSSQVSLDLLYFVGKKMEHININPYSSSTELVESAVPSMFSFHSSFFCPVLRSECTIDNYPSLLTCGHIISSRAVEKIASFRGAFFKCPYCPKEVHIRDILRLKLPV